MQIRLSDDEGEIQYSTETPSDHFYEPFNWNYQAQTPTTTHEISAVSLAVKNDINTHLYITD